MSSEGYLDLDRVIFIGRTYDEYMRMFDLEAKDLAGKRILDCPAGACSFTAHASKLGAEVTAVDIVYGLTSNLLAKKGMADIQTVREGMRSAKDEYIWDEFGDLDGLIQTRRSALFEFIKDYEENDGNSRYIEATLPHLPFPDGQFDLVLSGNFLFTYAEQFDYQFHQRTLFELLRVSSAEVRIYPLVSTGGQVHPYMPDLISEVEKFGYTAEIHEVPYQFQMGTTEMLCVKK